jgi:hypothetical protein
VRYFLTGKVQQEIMGWIGDIPVRGFLDVRNENFITDSKSTRSLYGFRYDVRSFDYDIQAYIYTQHEQMQDFYWVVQDTSSPHLCGVYKASELTLQNGADKFQSAVNNIRRWLDTPTKDTSSFALFGEI